MDSDSLSKIKSFLQGEPYKETGDHSWSPAISLTAQLVGQQTQQPIVHQNQAFSPQRKQFLTPPSVSVCGIALKLALKDIVEEKFKAHKGDDHLPAGIAQEATNTIFKNLVDSSTGYLKQPNRITEIKQPLQITDLSLLALATKTRELVNSMLRLEGERLERGLADRLVKWLVHDAMNQIDLMQKPKDAVDPSRVENQSTRKETRVTKASLPADASHFIWKPITALVQEMVTARQITIDDRRMKDLVQKTLDVGVDSVKAVIASPVTIESRSGPLAASSSKLTTHGPLVHGFEAILQKSFKHSTMSLKQLSLVAHRLAWALRCKLGESIKILSKSQVPSSTKSSPPLGTNQLIREPITAVVKDMVASKGLVINEQAMKDLVERVSNTSAANVRTIIESGEIGNGSVSTPSIFNPAHESLIQSLEKILKGSPVQSPLSTEQLRAVAENLAWGSRSQLGIMISALQKRQTPRSSSN